MQDYSFFLSNLYLWRYPKSTVCILATAFFRICGSQHPGARDDHTAALSIHKHLVKAILEHRHDHRSTKDPMHNNLISVHGNPYSNEAIDTIQWLMIEPTRLKKVHSLYKSVHFHSIELYYILFKMDSNLHV